MANQQHVERLADVAGWNAWRVECPEVRPDLSGADLNNAELVGIDFRNAALSDVKLWRARLTFANVSGADLTNAMLSQAELGNCNLAGSKLNCAKLVSARLFSSKIIGASLHRTCLYEADLRNADFTGADLTNANLRGSNLSEANLTTANLTGADLVQANLKDARLSYADLRDSNLTNANLSNAVLGRAEMSGATIGFGVIAGLWKAVRSLSEINHVGPSIGSFDAATRADGGLPETFLRGCGLRDWEIWATRLHAKDLTSHDIGVILEHISHHKLSSPIQPRAVFISYSSRDHKFVDRLASSLRSKGVRYWRDTDHMVAGPMSPQIDRAITLHRTILLVLSKDALASDWVSVEVNKARKLEKEGAVDYALCPITIDRAWENPSETNSLPERLRFWMKEKYNILSFTEDDDFDNRFEQLLEGLGIYYADSKQADS